MVVLFICLMLAVFGKLIGFAARAAWGVFKTCLVILFPIILIGMVFAGFMYVAVAVFLIVGLITLIGRAIA